MAGRIQACCLDDTDHAQAERDAEMMLLVVGDAPDKWDDLERFWDMQPGKHDVCCINKAGLTYPCNFKFWVSWHPDLLLELAKQRPGPSLWSCREHPGINYATIPHTRGSSAMVAVQLGLHVWNYDRVVLAGCPLSGSYEHYVEHWQVLTGENVRSMSGNTAELLGEPDKQFIQ